MQLKWCQPNRTIPVRHFSGSNKDHNKGLLRRSAAKYIQTMRLTRFCMACSAESGAFEMKAGKMSSVAEKFCPLDLFEECARSCAAAAVNKGLKLFACADATLPPWVSGDAARIRQIVSDLLANAIKFTDSGRVTFRLKVTYIESDQVSMQWQICDTGMGLSQQQLALLLSPYPPDDGSDRAAWERSVVSICAVQSALIGARLDVVSERGLGTSFSLHTCFQVISGSLHNIEHIDLKNIKVDVRAPLEDIGQCLVEWLRMWGARATLLPTMEMKDRGSIIFDISPALPCVPGRPIERIIASEQGSRTPEFTERGWEINVYDIRAIAGTLMQVTQHSIWQTNSTVGMLQDRLDLRVLVAEGNPIKREVLKEQLQVLGARVIAVEDGEQALLIWQDRSFDTVITNVKTPKIDGYQLTRCLRELGATLPIIGLTTNDMREEKTRCLEVGMSDLLIQPISLRALQASLSAQGSPSLLTHFPECKVEVFVEPTDDLGGWIALSPAMHSLFVTTMLADLAIVESALKETNTSKLISYLHRMHGSFATVRATMLAAACNECEIALHRAPLSPNSKFAIDALLKRSHAVLARLKK